ncbi:MAG: 50S ribosomal protein L3 [Pedobacter sp.]|nr:MAG: 50S ribosomal protein L3 [Pedobacter sp.]
MTIGLLGKKVGMTQIYDAKGNVVPVTIIQAGPCQVTQIKSKEKCGYNAIQIGYLEAKNIQKQLTKPEIEHLAKFKLPLFLHLKEYIVSDVLSYSIGSILDVNQFEIGEKVSISGRTIGKGNTGNVKLHHFNRGAMTHGSKHHRLQGSLGAGTSPGRVFPGKRMPRRSGYEQRTIKNLEVVDIFPSENAFLVKGSVPGKPGNLLKIKKS